MEAEQEAGVERELARDGLGNVRIADEVVATVAGIAATEVAGIAGMSGGLVGGITEMLGRRNLQKGVKVEVGDRDCTVDLYVIVEFGVRIPEVAQKVQESVRRAIETMTGLAVKAVNVHVQGVQFDTAHPAEDAGHKERPGR